MYQLFHDKNNIEMRIEPMKCMGIDKIVPGKVVQFNKNYYICDDRKVLNAFARELKQRWIDELNIKIEKCENMVIKRKYK